MPSTARQVRKRIGRRVVLTVSLLGLGACRPDPASQPITAVAARLASTPSLAAELPPELRTRLAAAPMAFFRFVNGAWTREVCEAFSDEARELPTVRLHGDAHVEQYAMTATARGLDDFDDSARGPAVIDIVRFVGSLELAAAQRGWTASLPAAIDAFLAGYRQGLENPSYLPPDPAVVVRMRRAAVKSQEAFLLWTDSLMQPLAVDEVTRTAEIWRRVTAVASDANPAFTPAFMALKKVGWLRLGIGSALTPKLLIRIEGPTAALDDDIVLEGKQMLDFQSDSCVSLPPSVAAFRVVQGIRQIGRLQPPFLLALPAIEYARADPRDWWATAWDRSYTEVTIADLDSPQELRELAHDAGAQLGSSNLAEASGPEPDQSRSAELQAITRLEPRIRQVAHDLTAALVQAWEAFRTARSARQP